MSTADSAAHRFIRGALERGALELLPEGRRLKSGRISYHFFNSGKFVSGSDQSFLAHAYALMLHGKTGFEKETDALYGPPYKGIGLAHTVGMRLFKDHGIDIGIASSRKEAKAHGEGGIHIGSDLDGKNVCLIDDVMTTGGSLNDAVEYIKSCGGIPVSCAIAFDRKERDSEQQKSAVDSFVERHGIPVWAIANVSHLVDVLEVEGHKYPNGERVLEKIQVYLKQYGV